MNKQSLATKTTRSAAWLFGQGFITNLIGLGTVAILARKLDPKDFGLVALAGVLLNLVFVFGQSTVGNYVIYDRKDGREARVVAAFWLNMALALAAVLIVVPFSSLLAKFYDETLLQPVLLVIMLRFTLGQVSIIPEALIRRELDYRLLVIRTSALQFVAALLGIGMALTGWGVWSLILPGVVVSIPRAIITMWMAGWYPNFRFGFQYWREIFVYIRSLIGTTLLQTLQNDGDTLVIGKLLGSQALGIYDRAWRTSNLITQNLAWTIADVAMPSLSALKERPEAMRQAYHRMLRFLGIVAFPLLIGMFVVADEFVLLLYGPKWVETVLPLRILIVFTLQRAISSPVGVLFNAVGRPDIGLKLTLAMLPLYFTGIFAGAHFGINGVAVAVTGIRTLGGFAAVYLACRLVQLSVLKVLKSLGPPLAIALLMAAAVYGVKLFLSSLFNLPVAISLLIYISVGGFVYFILLSTLFIPQMDEILFAIDNFSVKVGSRLRLLLRLKKQSREPIA